MNREKVLEALDYAINAFETVVKDGKYEGMKALTVCELLWNSKLFPDDVVKNISTLGFEFNEKISKKYNIPTGHLYWFVIGIQSNKARLEVLNKIKEKILSIKKNA